MKKWRMGNSCASDCRAGSIARVGKAVPTIEKLSTPHSEHMLIAIRIEGNSPNMNTPKPCDANTVSTPKPIMLPQPPGCGKSRMPNV